MSMKNLSILFLAAGSFCSSALVLASDANAEQQHSYYISAIPQEKNHSFYHRMISKDSQIIVHQDKALYLAHGGKELNLTDDQQLYFYEEEPGLNSDIGFSDWKYDAVSAFIGNEQAEETFHLQNPTVKVHKVHFDLQFNQRHNNTKTTAPQHRTQASGQAVNHNKLLKQPPLSQLIPINRDYVREKIEQFSGEQDIQVNGQSKRLSNRQSSSNKKLARAFLKQELTALGYTVNNHSYQESFYQGENFVATRPGADSSKFLVLSGHYDTVYTQGADDDGSGMVAALAVAHALKDQDLAYDLRIVGFDQEEDGLIGSKAYARKLNNSGELSQMIGLIQMEMLGYDQDQDGAYHIIDCNDRSSTPLSTSFVASVQQAGLNLTRSSACTNRSDHASFWNYGAPAVVISQNFFGGDSNPCYHRSCDTVNQFNWDYYYDLIQGVTQTVASILQ